MNFLTWARRLLRPNRPAARPVPSVPDRRVMHLSTERRVPACGEPLVVWVFMTTELPAVTCPACRKIANWLDVRREVSAR